MLDNRSVSKPARHGSARWRTSLLLLGLLGSPTLSFAGTGHLVSQWMTRAPEIDGRIGATEWSEATLVDLGAGMSVRIGSDWRTLYIGVLDAGDSSLGLADKVYVIFDDEGGTAPTLDDGAFAHTFCQEVPNLGEGQLELRHDQAVLYDELYNVNSACFDQPVNDRVSYRSAAQPEGVTYEAAIPLDGPTALRARPGERFGLWLLVIRNNNVMNCLPNCLVGSPADYRNLILASGGCNTGPQGFGAGIPHTGLPLDWISALTVGSGESWDQSVVFGDPVFCEGNETGGPGASACVANILHTTARADARLRMPLSVAGQESVNIRLLANLTVDGAHEYLDIGVRHQDTSGTTLLFWLDENLAGPVDLPVPLGGSLPVELWFTHSTFSRGGTEGGFAQVDEVELRCGPTLFADDFESALLTHWTSVAP